MKRNGCCGMNVSEYIAEFLSDKGMRDVFFVDGSAAATMQVAIDEHPKLNYWCPRHEQGGAMACDGYYKTSRKPAVMIATSGPGGQNLVTGIACSWYDSVPAFYLTGNINSRFLKPSDEIRQHGFQEGDPVSMVKGITKFAHQVTRPEDIRYYLEKAYHLMMEGRKGPVLLDIPMDVQKAHINPEELPTYFTKFNDDDPGEGLWAKNKEKSKRVYELLLEAKRPFLLIGGGVFLDGAEDKVRAFIQTFKIPYAVTWNMIDFGSYDDPYYAGRVGTFGGDGRNFAIQNCDLLIAIGSRISGRITGGMVDTFARGAKKVIIDIDQDELRWQQVKGDINVCSTVREFLDWLPAGYSPNLPNWEHWRELCISWRDKYRIYKPEYRGLDGRSINPYHFIHKLSSHVPADAIIVHEAGGNCVVTSQGFETKIGQRIFTNNGNSSLGYALPAAIGAAIATEKKRPVYCICGDGGIQFNQQELSMISQYDLPIKVIIFDNAAYGITKAYRDTNFNSNYAGVDADHGVKNPDFKHLSLAHGLPYTNVENNRELDRKLCDTYFFDFNGPLVIRVNMEGYYDYHPKLGWRQPIEDQYPFLDREEFISNMIIEPHPSWEDPRYP